jgi:hypothetical protein
VRESVMPQGEFAVNGRPKVVLRKRDGRTTSHSFHLSVPSSSCTPPIDSYSLNDIAAGHSSSQRPSSFSSASYKCALSDDVQRPESIGYDLTTAACDVSAPRKSVSFSRSTYSSVSGSGTPRAPVATTAVPEESLSSSASSPSSDDVFMSVAGSRECSTSPFERQSKTTRAVSRPGRSPDSATRVEPSRRSSSTVDGADGSRRSVETRSDVFYSAADSDSDSEPLGGSRQALSNPNHCISDLCSDDEGENVTDHIRRNQGVAANRFQSPKCCHSSQSARHNDDAGEGSEHCERAKQELCSADLEGCAADGVLSSAAVVYSEKSVRTSALGIPDGDDITTNVDTNSASVASDSCVDEDLYNDNVRTAAPVSVGDRPATRVATSESSRCGISAKEHTMTEPSAQRDTIGGNAELVDERQKSSSDGCREHAAGESDGHRGNDSHGEDWLFIDDTDDDVCNEASATKSGRIADETRSSPAMTQSSVHNTTTSDLSFESPFHSPPTSPTLMDAITDVWLRGIGATDEHKCKQDMKSELCTNDASQSDSTAHESQQQQQQGDETVVDSAGSRVLSFSPNAAGVSLDNIATSASVGENLLIASGDSSIGVEALSLSNNAVADAIQTSQSSVDALFAPVDAAAAFEKSTQTERHLRRSQSTPSNAVVSSDDDTVFDSPVESAATVPDVIRDAESSCLANSSAASLRKKSVKELKNRFEQNSSKETVAGSAAAAGSSKTPPPQYARSQSYHGFDAADPASGSCPTGDVASGSSKLGKSIGVLTVDVVPHAAEARSVVLRRPEAAAIIRRREYTQSRDDNVDDDAGSSGTSGSRAASRSIDDELQFVSQQCSIPSVSARISCFEPLLSTARKSPEFHTTPENKRARLSSCGSSVGGQTAVPLNDSVPAADHPDATYSSEADRMKVNAELSSRYRSPLFGCDLLTLLDIPAATAKALPRVSERKRIFEAEPSKPANSSGQQGSQKNCSIIETSEDQQVENRSLMTSDKENSCSDRVAAASSRRKLFDDSVQVADSVCSPENSDPKSVKGKLSEVKMNGGGSCSSSGKTELCQQ